MTLQQLRPGQCVTLTYQNGHTYKAFFQHLMTHPNGAVFTIDGDRVSVLSAEVNAGWCVLNAKAAGLAE